MRKNMLQMKAPVLAALVSLGLMMGVLAAQTPAVNPPRNVDLKQIHQTLDDMDKELDELHENSLRGHLTRQEVHGQITHIVYQKFVVMDLLPPWGSAIGVPPHGDRWGEGYFFNFYDIAQPLDRELDQIAGEADSIAAVWGRMRSDSQGSRSSILLRMSYAQQQLAQFQPLFAFNLDANEPNPHLRTIHNLYLQMKQKLAAARDGYLNGTITAAQLTPKISEIKDLKYQIMTELPPPFGDPGFSFKTFYTAFVALDRALEDVDAASTAADAFFSTTDKYDVAAAVTAAIADKRHLEILFPPATASGGAPPVPPVNSTPTTNPAGPGGGTPTGGGTTTGGGTAAGGSTESGTSTGGGTGTGGRSTEGGTSNPSGATPTPPKEATPPPPPEKPAPSTESNGNQSGTNTTPGASSTEPTTNVAVSTPATGAPVSEPGVQTTQPQTTSGGVTTPSESQPGQTTTGGTPGASQTIPEAQVRIVKQDTNDFGSGTQHEVNTDTTGKILKWRDVDPKGNVREDGIDQYSTTPSGTSVKTEETRDYFSDHGTLNARTISDWDFSGKLTSYRLTDYSFRGSKISDHITKYETEGHLESTWNPRTYDWSSTTIPYTGAASPAATPTQPGNSLGTQMNWNLRVDYKIGCLFPLDYHAGDQFSGSCWKADYAEGFKTVPGLSEYTLPIKTYTLQDGTPNWSDLEIGIKGYGYAPLGSDGRFSLHIPMDWKGPLQFQVRQPDYLTGNTPFTTNFEVGDPSASPTLPQNLLPTHFRDEIDYDDADYLVDLWNEAFDLEEERDELLENGEHYPGEICDVEDDLDDVYDELDYAPDYLPTSVIVSMARRMAQHNRDLNAELRTENLTPEQETRLQGYDRWAMFLENEADYFTKEAAFYSHYPITPYWESPVQSQDKLIAIRGPFFGDPYNTGIYIDRTLVHPIAMTPKFSYFMPTPGLTAGEHTYIIDGPGIPETTLPFFYMWMTMWGDDLNLHKGQRTNYHLKLDLKFNGSNSLFNSTLSSSFFPLDLVSPSELQGSPMPGPSRKGTITVSVTNDPTDAVTMKDVFKTYDASQFEPQGSIQLDGGLTAVRDGTFRITGVARAYLQPILGLGLWPATTPSASTPTSEPLLPNYGWSLTPISTGTSSIPSCPTGSAGTTTPGTTGTPTSSPTYNFNLPISHCMGSAAFDDYTKAIGGQPTVEVGNPPTQGEADAARTRVRDAQQKATDAETNYHQAEDKWANLWVKGLYNIPEEDRKKYQAIADESLHADVAWDNAVDELIKSSSVENGKKLEDASIRRATANDAYEKAKKEALDKFSPKDRAAYDAATKDMNNAAIDRSIANEELRDARAALEELHLPLSTWLKYAF